ncbi:MAG: bis(5'-nucleosyl)-tetraphosphatase (symmetrical) YqeK [Candidatus Obscuribacterales bacterium]|nr:bis(5'-nucleosyl)-tetraphosphatase (symmetrical) YqeK [Cyanobacteria bacterium HKST-UBA01]MCB9471203.1 bis(5'-nucleosyl)-tetraphosphatase (symmetrical) YqeK [Candidatus Obscuribacterales bacterium]
MSKSKNSKTSSSSGLTPTDGIPADLELDKVKKWVRSRVTAKRYKHIKGVADVGKRLAKACGVEELPVLLACWLHDSCKEIKATELITMARSYGMELSTMDERNGHILHGPVASYVVQEQFGITNHDVLSGISEHTLGATTMTRISKVVYLADILEASRPEALTEPIWNALTRGGDKVRLNTPEMDSNLDLDGAILKASDLVIAHLLEKGKAIHPKAVDVRNHFLEAVKNQETASSREPCSQ